MCSFLCARWRSPLLLSGLASSLLLSEPGLLSCSRAPTGKGAVVSVCETALLRPTLLLWGLSVPQGLGSAICLPRWLLPRLDSPRVPGAPAVGSGWPPTLRKPWSPFSPRGTVPLRCVTVVQTPAPRRSPAAACSQQVSSAHRSSSARSSGQLCPPLQFRALPPGARAGLWARE